MQEAKLVCEVSTDEKGELTRYLPAISSDKLTMATMIDHLESKGQWKISLPQELIKTEGWKKAISIRFNYIQAAKDLKLRDILDKTI